MVTEGGLTNSVIGTIKAARKLYSQADEAARHLYYVYNNPDEVLREFERILTVFDDDGITKISLHTGPMALGGSTRMQASTI